jgi:CRISPR type III-B/RAMP module RAMP protein Cmr1
LRFIIPDEEGITFATTTADGTPMPESLAFQIECISPTLNLGAEDAEKKKYPEDEIFRATSLRGCWRFWARAAIVGAMEKPCSDTLRLLENSLFGSTEPAFQTFRMRVIPSEDNPSKKQFAILPHKPLRTEQAWKEANSPLSRATVLLSFNHGLAAYKKSLKPEEADKVPIWDEAAKNALLAVIWLWGNLGGIGTRSRRGFGSVALLADSEDKDPFAAAGLPRCRNSFSDRAALIEHLQSGITCAFQIIREWVKAREHSLDLLHKPRIEQFRAGVGAKDFSPLLSPNRSADKDMFVFNSLAQVFVGNMFQSCNDLLEIIADKNAIADETGSAIPRRASPMIVRIHRCAEDFVPVLTWSPIDTKKLKIAKDKGNGPWLENKMGFDKPLHGDSIYA